MRLFNSAKILSYYNEAKDLYNGELCSPRMALIYPSYACNFNCPYCLYKGWKKKAFMPFELFERLTIELKIEGVKAIEFCGGGEPTLHPNFMDMVDCSVDKGFEVGLFTNGSMLDKYGPDLSKKLTYIRISVDAQDEKTFNKIHGLKKNSFEDYTDSIINTVGYRNAEKSKCSIGIKVLLTNEEINIDRCVEYMETVGADYIQFKMARNCKQEPTEDQKAKYFTAIRKFNYDKVKDCTKQTAIGHKCFLTPIHTMIDAYGDVYLCCYYQYRSKSHKIGNICDRPFASVWWSDRHYEARKNIKPSECNVYDCRFHEYNKIMRGVVEKNDLHLNFI